MSKSPYKNLTEQPPPYDQPPPVQGHGMTAMPPAPTGLPQSDPSYGYDQQHQPQMPMNQHTTNVVQVQPGMPGGMMGPTTVVVTSPEPIPSMAGHITLSCFVFWCCSPLFGAIAFFVALSGMSATTPRDARQMGKASLGINIAGIIISVIIAAIIIGLAATGKLNYYAEDPYTFTDNNDFYGTG